MSKILDHRVSVIANGYSCEALVDTGATAGSIDLSLASGLTLCKPKVVKQANGDQRRATAYVPITLNGITLPVRMTLADRSHSKTKVLLGREFIQAYATAIQDEVLVRVAPTSGEE